MPSFNNTFHDVLSGRISPQQYQMMQQINAYTYTPSQQPEVVMPTCLSNNTLLIYFDETNNVYGYVNDRTHNRIGVDEQSVITFCAAHSHRYNIIPRIGSNEFNAMLDEGRQSDEEITMTLAKPADEFSIVISYSDDDGCYKVTSASGRCEMFTSRYTNLDEAYSVARNMKANNMWNDPTKPWKVWPRKGSSAHAMLIEKIDTSVTASAAKFMSMFADLQTSLNSRNAEAYEMLYKVIKYINKKRLAKGFSSYADVENLNRFIKAFTGVEYVMAWTDSSGTTRLVHPDNTTNVYIGVYKSEGYRTYTKNAAKLVAKQCSYSGDYYLSQSLINHNNKLYCRDSMDAIGMYRCSLCPTWHHEDAGCPEYHRMPFEYIHGYSQDVRKIIHKMYSVPSDKKVNGEFLRYGVELEVLPKDNVASRVARYNCGIALHNYALLKSDSSLGREGFEIVTVPATLEFHRTQLWRNFFNTPYIDGLTAGKSVKSWHTNVCGIHVHVTRAALTEMQLSKMLVFYHEPYNSTFLSRIAGRKVGPDAVYCKAAKKKLRASVTRECGDHHGAITISSRNKGKTAEVRIFRGNSTYHGVMRAIEFVDATVKWCGQNSSDAVLDYKNFLNWFNQPTIKKQYPELRKHLIDLKYLKSRLKEGEIPHPKATTDVVKLELKQA